MPFSELRVLRLDDVSWLVRKGVRLRVLAAQELVDILLIAPDDLRTILVWLQFPEDDLVIVFADGDETGVVL